MNRGFIFTADALFALTMLSAVALMFTVFSTQPEYSAKTARMQVLAYDYLKLNVPPASLSKADFQAETKLALSTTEATILKNKMIAAHAVHYAYNNSCKDKDCSFENCEMTNAEAGAADSCLQQQAAQQWGTLITEAWVVK